MTSDDHNSAGPFYEEEAESSVREVEVQAPNRWALTARETEAHSGCAFCPGPWLCADGSESKASPPLSGGHGGTYK